MLQFYSYFLCMCNLIYYEDIFQSIRFVVWRPLDLEKGVLEYIQFLSPISLYFPIK